MNNRTFTIAKLISTFTNTIQQEEKKRGAVHHYLIQYDHVPLWVLKNFMTFGNIQWMYFFVEQPIKDKIARYFAEEYKSNYNENHFFSDETLLSVLKTTNFFRNICAHEERLYNFRIHRRPSTTQIASILSIDSNLLLVRVTCLH